MKKGIEDDWNKGCFIGECESTTRLLSPISPILSPILFLMYINRIVKKSEACGGVKIGDCTVPHLLFADDFVLLDSTQIGLQQALDRFSDACCVAKTKISTTKTESMHLY